MKDEFILENGEKYSINNKTKLLLIPELLESNQEKLNDYYDEKRKTFIRYDREGQLLEDRIVASRKTGWGYLDSKGKEKIPFIYDSANSFSEGLAKVSKNGKTGFIDKDGNIVIPFSAAFDEYVGSFHNGMALLRHHSKYGYINKRGRRQISMKYDEANSFSEELASVKKNSKWGFIDKQGNTVLPFIYDGAKSFNEGIAPVKKGDKWGCIDKKGNEVVPFVFEEISNYHNQVALACHNASWGFINKNGKDIVPCVYFMEAITKDFDNDLRIINNYLTYRNEVNRVKTIKLSDFKRKCLSKHITYLTKFCEENNQAISFDLETKEIALVNRYSMTNETKSQLTSLAKKRTKKKYNRIYF